MQPRRHNPDVERGGPFGTTPPESEQIERGWIAGQEWDKEQVEEGSDAVDESVESGYDRALEDNDLHDETEDRE
jgi:hypothetical protein